MRHHEPFVDTVHPGAGGAFSSNGAASNSPNGTRDPEHASRLAQLTEHNPDAICVIVDGHFVYFNAVAMRWLGARRPDELIGHGLSRFVDGHSIPLLMARWAGLRDPGEAAPPCRVTLARLDGSRFDVDAVSVITTWRGSTAYQLLLRDVVERHATQVATAQQATLVEHAGDAIIAVTRSGIVTSWNPSAERIYRRSAHRTLALPIHVAVGAPVDLPGIVAANGVAHATHHALDGSARTVRVSVREFDNGYVLVCSDETTLRRAARNLRTIVNTLPEGVLVIDRNGWLLTINPAARRILGLRAGGTHPEDGGELTDLPVYESDGRLLEPHERPIERAFATGLPTIGRVLGIDTPDGRRVWLSTACQLLDPEDLQRSPVLMSFTDITSQRATTEYLAHQAAHDGLTGLPNRAHILETVNTLHRQNGKLSAVLFIDLDDLKTVNDTLGHDVGDTVIEATAARLRHAVRGRDIVGRFAGDEFVALLIGDLENAALDRFVERIQTVLAQPIEVPGGTLQVGASIGVIQTHHADSRDAASLLRAADTAMYAAKAKGRRASNFSKLTRAQH